MSLQFCVLVDLLLFGLRANLLVFCPLACKDMVESMVEGLVGNSCCTRSKALKLSG